MESKRLKRIINEIRELEKSKNILEKDGIYFHYNEEKVDQIIALIVGPEKTPYENGFYLFTFTYPDTYPMTPPLAIFCTKGSLHHPVKNSMCPVRFNPNLYHCGKVCLSMLNTWKGEGWVPTMTITSVLIAIQGLVLNEEPLRNEPGYETSHIKTIQKYNQIIEYANIKIAVIQIINNIPNEFRIFQDIVNTLFMKNVEYYRNFILDRNQKYKDDICESNVYDMKTKLSYDLLLKELDDIEEKIINELFKNKIKMGVKEIEII
jgi:ubiquitin-protein ligase